MRSSTRPPWRQNGGSYVYIYHTTLPFDLGWLGFRRFFFKTIFPYPLRLQLIWDTKKKVTQADTPLKISFFTLGLKLKLKKKSLIWDLRRVLGAKTEAFRHHHHSLFMAKVKLQRFWRSTWNDFTTRIPGFVPSRLWFLRTFRYVFSPLEERMYLSLSLSVYTSWKYCVSIVMRWFHKRNTYDKIFSKKKTTHTQVDRRIPHVYTHCRGLSASKRATFRWICFHRTYMWLCFVYARGGHGLVLRQRVL